MPFAGGAGDWGVYLRAVCHAGREPGKAEYLESAPSWVISHLHQSTSGRGAVRKGLDFFFKGKHF